MTFNLTITGESPEELLTALRQLSAPQPPETAPVTQPGVAEPPAPAKTKKPTQKPAAAAPEKKPVPPQTETPTDAPLEQLAAPEIPVKDPAIEGKIRSLAVALSGNGKRAEVQQIITGTGAKGISSINPEDYSTVWAQLLALDAEVNANAAG